MSPLHEIHDSTCDNIVTLVYISIRWDFEEEFY